MNEVDHRFFPIRPAADLYLFLTVRGIQHGNIRAVDVTYPAWMAIPANVLPGKLATVLVKDTQKFFTPVSAEMGFHNNLENTVPISIPETGIPFVGEQR